jgi:hypothetical protein
MTMTRKHANQRDSSQIGQNLVASFEADVRRRQQQRQQQGVQT